jgi:hypothetical protein
MFRRYPVHTKPAGEEVAKINLERRGYSRVVLPLSFPGQEVWVPSSPDRAAARAA